MLKPRIIVVLLRDRTGLVKTTRFKDRKYVGDPINTIRIFNEKEVDELCILDIDATTNKYEPNYDEISIWANECRMPLAYGGGIKSVEQAQRILKLGVEKTCLNTICYTNPTLIKLLADQVGSQSVVPIIDVKKDLFGKYSLYINNGKTKVSSNLKSTLLEYEKLGAGEIIINNIERDGIGNGYDLELISIVRETLTIPISVVGGAGNNNHFKELFQKFPIIGAGAGSYFVFKGKYKAVLITYPSKNEKTNMYCDETK